MGCQNCGHDESQHKSALLLYRPCQVRGCTCPDYSHIRRSA